MDWLDTRHRVFVFALVFVVGAVMVELVLPDSFAWWQRILFGWIPVSLVMEQGLARYMGWARPRPEADAHAAQPHVAYEPIGRPNA